MKNDWFEIYERLLNEGKTDDEAAQMAYEELQSNFANKIDNERMRLKDK